MSGGFTCPYPFPAKPLLMDLSFVALGDDELAGGAMPVAGDLSLMLVAAAAVQATSPTVRALHTVLRGQGGHDERLRSLAQIFAPRETGAMVKPSLDGSFNPFVAGILAVGRE